MKKKLYAIVSILLIVIMLIPGMIRVGAIDNEKIDVNSRAHILIDFDSGTEICSENKEKRLQIASMVKIMTLDLIFDSVDEGKLSLSDDISVSENASSMGGSQAFLDAGGVYKAEELIKSIIVASANDSCVAMAEHIAGSVESFVYMMNEKAEKLGMLNTNFVNCTGLPAPNGYSSAEDVAKMSIDMMKHKQFFDYSKIWMFDFIHPDGRITTLTNTNKLSRFYNGCDGGKTGFTSEALSCLSATAKRDNMRLLCVVVGAPDAKTRNGEVAKLLNYGFANYANIKILSYEDVGKVTVSVSGGKKDCVFAVPESEIFQFGKKNEMKNKYTFDVVAERRQAPVHKGDVVGKVEVKENGEVFRTVNLIAEQDVAAMNYGDLIKKIAKNW